MDSLILSLTPAQHKKYLSLVGKDDVVFDFQVDTIEFDEYSDENVKIAKSNIVTNCEKLMSFAKRDLFFSATLTKEEIEKLVPIYFGAVSEISKAKQELYGEAIAISKKINDVEKKHMEISSKYADFLPYKAALSRNEKYKDEIFKIDNEFNNEINKLIEKKQLLANELARISKICDKLIPDFFATSSHAADSPKFKNFNDKEFFAAVSMFIEQIKNV